MSRAKLLGSLFRRPAVQEELSAPNERVDGDSDSSLNQTLAILEMVVIDTRPPVVNPPAPSNDGAIKERTLDEWRELERAEVQKRVADFRERQRRFQLSREAYCESILERVFINAPDTN